MRLALSLILTRAPNLSVLSPWLAFWGHWHLPLAHPPLSACLPCRLVPPDIPAALVHYTFAAKSGDPVAQMSLGYRHMHGIDVPRSCQTGGLGTGRTGPGARTQALALGVAMVGCAPAMGKPRPGGGGGGVR